MDTVQQHLATFQAAHPVAFAFIVLPFIAAVANLGIWYLTSSKWEAFQASHPRVAAFAKLLRALGVDPVGILKWGYFLAFGRPWAPPVSAKDEPPST